MHNKRPILVHACCASCSSYVIPHLQENFHVSAFFYNPNIYPEKEYILRLEEMKFLCNRLNVSLTIGPYDTSAWAKAIFPYRNLPEKSKRCWECYNYRLYKTAEKAADLGIGLFTTTLSVSPHKIYKRIEEGGKMAAERYEITFHNEDFKKKDGFKISVERSKQLGLTRQNYCGCVYSLRELQERLRKKKERDRDTG
jgi:predicted adenine nucleotide alpha hydrolase (AANH) superfamily ATPase